MTTTWLSGARKHDLHPGIGNGPFRNFYGVILHVNVDEHGTPASFWGNGNRGQVCPNFQVFKDGSIDQMLPFDWQPWCQIEGNFNYAAIETAGLPSEPLTDAQMASIARILRIYHDEHGMPYQLANSPGQRGLGTHQMGGAAWGGHACPGVIRTGQRSKLLTLAAGSGGATAQEEFTMDAEAKAAFAAVNKKIDALPESVWDHPIAGWNGTHAASAFLTNAHRFATGVYGVTKGAAEFVAAEVTKLKKGAKK